MTETKRDVFDEVRYKFRNFKNGHRHGMYASPDSIDHYLSDALKRYYAALPDDLPVIPKAVSEYIERQKQGSTLRSAIISATDFNTVDDEEADWVFYHSETFALAWLLGVWRVEETGEIVKLEEEK